MKADGSVEKGDIVRFELQPGEVDSCQGSFGFQTHTREGIKGELERGWLLVVANEPVLPEGQTFREFIGDAISHYVHSKTFYPINCTDSGQFEFICSFVADFTFWWCSKSNALSL